MFEQRRVGPGTRLTLEGASGYSFFVIEEGTVQVERAGRLLETLGPGDFFGEAAILTGERRNASVTAASDASLFVLFGTPALAGAGEPDPVRIIAGATVARRVTVLRSHHRVALLPSLDFVDPPWSTAPTFSRNVVTVAVQPVWWLAPTPRPVSPWKYSLKSTRSLK